MATRDPRDPRTKARPVGEQLDHLAANFDVIISTLAAQLGEVIRTQQEANAHLAVMSRSVADHNVAGGGVGGVAAPSISGGPVGAQERMVASMQADAARRTAAPYTAGINYTVSATGGSLGAQTRSGIRAGVANWLTGRADYLADQHEIHAGETLDPFTGAVMGVAPGYYMDEHGRYRDTGGRFASKADAVATIMTGEERGALGARLAQANVMSRMGQAWSESGHVGRAVLAGLPQGALKAAGVAGAVITAGKEGWEWVQGQYAANRKFQEVYGGSNMDQIGDRLDRFANHWRGNFSLLGADNYDKLFDSGMNMGLRGGDRDRYIRTGADIMGTGANAQQATGIMNMSIEAGLGLGGLAQAIRDVNNAAREAGINAGRAREIFMKNYEASSDIMFGSQNAKSYATLLTTGQLNQALPYQGINTAPLTADISFTSLRASQLGMTLSEIDLAQKSSASGTILGTEQTLKGQLDMAPNPEGKGTTFRQAVDEFLGMLKDRGEEYIPRYHQMELGEYVISKGWNSHFLVRFLASYGMQVEESKAAGYLANMYTEQSAGNVGARSESERRSELAPRTGSAYYTRGQGVVPLDEKMPYDPSVYQTDMWSAYSKGQPQGADVKNRAGNMAPSVTQYMVNEELISQASKYGITGDTKVRVQTKDGPRTISFTEALRDFGDQIQNGTARFVGGIDDAYMDKTSAQVLGFTPDKTTQVPVTSTSKKIDYGQTDEEVAAEEKKAADKKKEQDGRSTNVTVGLTPEARRLLTVIDSPYYSTTATSGATTP